MTKQGRTAWVFLSLTLLSAHMLSVIYHDCRDVCGHMRPRPDDDRVTLAERRFDQANRELPRAGLVGYFRAQSEPIEPWEEAAAFFIAQYALAPRVLVRNGQQDFNVLSTDDRVQVFRAKATLSVSKSH